MIKSGWDVQVGGVYVNDATGEEVVVQVIEWALNNDMPWSWHVNVFYKGNSNINSPCPMQTFKRFFTDFQDRKDQKLAQLSHDLEEQEGSESPFVKIGEEVGKLVTEKNAAYGDAFAQSEKILRVLFPDGIPVEKYRDALAMLRVIDKLFRIANQKDAFGESPWNDICGYGILGIAADMAEEGKEKA